MKTRASLRMAGALCCILLLAAPVMGVAQTKALDIAQRYELEEESYAFGDIVTYDRSRLSYRLSRTHADENVFGVIVESPALLLDDGTSNAPVVRAGESMVNVVAANGAIAAGDYITTSAVLGKGERANTDDRYIVGIALAPYRGEANEAVGAEGDVAYGRIPILLSVGNVSKVNEILPGTTKTETEDLNVTEATILNIIQYVIAAIIAVGSVFIAFKNFGPNIREGVASIGRNPLAKSSIQSMIILNVVLISLIGVGGLIVSLAILLLPI